MKFKPLSIFIIALLLNSCIESAKNKTAINYGAKSVIVIGDTVNELGNNIMAIYQDQKGIYWFASWIDGVYKFDGKNIIHFTTKHGLPSGRIEEIKEDKSGNIYFNTSEGICLFNGFRILKLDAKVGELSDWKLSVDDLWFKDSWNSESVYRYDGHTLYRLPVPKTTVGQHYLAKSPALSPYTVYCTYKDSRGNVWFGTSLLGVFRYNGKWFDWISEEDVTELHDGPANGVRSIQEDKEGLFWFNTEFKYDIYNQQTLTKNNNNVEAFYKRIKSIGCLDGKIGGDLNEYLSIIKDNSQNLWMAIYTKGVWKYDGVKIEHYPILADGKEIPIFCLFKDNMGEIWLGTEKNGVWKFNGSAFARVNL